jgi:uncharacterized protein YbaP (TraB family)
MKRLGRWLLAAALALAGPARAADCPPPPRLPDASTAARLAERATDHGLLWRIERDGHASYLYGTLHVGKLDWLFPGPALREAWAATEVLAVELDPADVAPELEQRPSEPLPARLAKRLEAQTRAACLPAQALAAYPPLLQLATLTVAAARRDGLEAGFGQDLSLMAQARQQGRPVQSLETVAEQLDALEPESPGEVARMLDEGLRQLERGEVRAPLRRLAEAWARSDLKTLADYPRWCRCADTPEDRAWLARVNDGRNPHLAERIEALHAAGQRLLVAVGALHLSGPQALPRLLQARGFRVEQILPRQ